jgi:streptogramin lyase
MRSTTTILCLLLSSLAITAAPSSGGPVARSLRLGGVPLQLLSARGKVWVLICDRGCSGQAKRSVGRIVAIDPRSGQAIVSAKLDRPAALAVGANGVYATDFWRDTVRRLDPRTLHPLASLHLTLPFFITTSTIQLIPAAAQLLVLGEWTSSGTATNRNGLARLDSASNRVLPVTALPSGQLTSAYGAGSLWVAHVNSRTLEQIDPRTGRLRRRLPLRVGVAIAFADGKLWTIFRDGTLHELAIR